MSDYLTRLVGRAVGNGALPEPLRRAEGSTEQPAPSAEESSPTGHPDEPYSSVLGPLRTVFEAGSRRRTEGDRLSHVMDETFAQPSNDVAASDSDLAIQTVVQGDRGPSRSGPAATTPSAEAARVGRRARARRAAPTTIDADQALLRPGRQPFDFSGRPDEPAGDGTIDSTEPDHIATLDQAQPSPAVTEPLTRAIESAPRAPRDPVLDLPTLPEPTGGRVLVPVRPRFPVSASEPKPLAAERSAVRGGRSLARRTRADSVESAEETQVSVHIGTVEIKAVPLPRSSRPEPPAHPAGFDGYRLMRSYFVRGG